MDEEIFRITKNTIRANSLIEMAKERLSDLDKKAKVYKVVEEYYEIIKELITALMYSNGLKTLSHKALIYYLKKTHKEFYKSEILLIDTLRKLRNDIVYYGQKIEKDFLVNNEEDIIQIIKKLIKTAKKNSN